MNQAAATINRVLWPPHNSPHYERLMRRPLRQRYDLSSVKGNSTFTITTVLPQGEKLWTGLHQVNESKKGEDMFILRGLSLKLEKKVTSRSDLHNVASKFKPEAEDCKLLKKLLKFRMSRTTP
ncbi:hypothetical protein AVEN_225171-1 [Araneus ventricosus]|uniref:Uncharacterized protein n=1 Tax=Araneus ventricosus TaxID=182803 RepID=A0A4Y2FRK8_ARAVE|nr:hypothetical protein AVEN_225171-1 [Araneus ventricosus]